ncbi:DNA polymerase III subunit beta [Candidatus Woesebacteria bacterium RIFCSPHIGHO2_01_FULL_44_21]|uniref:Beta sliding clamp n=1 Tax=Candidatus Woesebacteria bacterium RIFCSPHIGHO2_01_FULL_44_21 TaxID=1802503 RepID=A0A1F7YYN7_9BACT|nr:MAG: DNA polymerase III subunit beta [Candidatus Woesebacteria bacterium RIFCSPHIGHO2_01_FULL_44_21]OGM69704.1 MAG: DNA polymerase III subunit beta [Candidatus Woesebacteria bacterium RIFCSPLOWO2_01_FULL_44_24b]
MKITVLQKDLTKILSHSSRFVSSRAQLPILTNIKLAAQSSKLSIAATNLEMSCVASIGAQVESEGEVAVPSRILVDLVGSLRSDKITLSSEGETLKIEAEGFKGSLAGLNTSDFPVVPSALKESVALPKTDFLEAVGSTIFSCSTEASRPALAGVLFIFSEHSLSLVASDGFRLSKKTVNMKGMKAAKLILPKNILTELVRIAADAKKVSMEVSESERQVLFALDDVVISSRLVEGEYPPFEKIIPTSSSINTNVSKADFAAAIKTASVFAREAANVIILHIGEDTLKISAESARAGSQESSIAAKVDGPELDIPYNYRFIEEFLNVAKGESVVMKFNSTTSPGVFLDASDENYLHLIMPVKS